MYGNLQEWITTILKRCSNQLQCMPANGGQRMKVLPGFIFTSPLKILATRSEQRRRTYKRQKNNKFNTFSERTSAHTSECQIFSYARRTLGQFVIV